MAVVIGSTTDPHVQAVISAAGRGMTVLDAGTFLQQPFTLDQTGLKLGGKPMSGPGWLRRIATPDWSLPLRSDDLDSAIRQSCIIALATVLRDERIDWLTPA